MVDEYAWGHACKNTHDACIHACRHVHVHTCTHMHAHTRNTNVYIHMDDVRCTLKNRLRPNFVTSLLFFLHALPITDVATSKIKLFSHFLIVSRALYTNNQMLWDVSAIFEAVLASTSAKTDPWNLLVLSTATGSYFYGTIVTFNTMSTS